MLKADTVRIAARLSTAVFVASAYILSRPEERPKSRRPEIMVEIINSGATEVRRKKLCDIYQNKNYIRLIQLMLTGNKNKGELPACRKTYDESHYQASVAL